jgi:hypothetical protein
LDESDDYGEMGMKIRSILAISVMVFILALLAIIIFAGAGGERALFLILGHLAAWAEMILIFYFRKKPRTED